MNWLQYWYMKRPRLVYKSAFPVRKGSDYIPFFNLVFLTLQESKSADFNREQPQSKIYKDAVLIAAIEILGGFHYCKILA